MSIPVSLVIPVFNEQSSLTKLVATIQSQTVQPAEVIIVDGGSTDNTLSLAHQLTAGDSRFRIIEAGRAMPGKGRNIGAQHATQDWLAFTDAGIFLEGDWLEKLIEAAKSNPEAGIIYGNLSPLTRTTFEKCAAIAYVPPLRPGEIRTKSIASYMIKKELWAKAGGFPDYRAAEDLIFIENAEKTGAPISFAPDAFIHWELRPGFGATYRRFQLYSKYNIWAGRAKYWHYGVARQYALVFLLIMAAIFHHWLWLAAIPLWLLARALKQIFRHRFQFGLGALFNPVIVVGVILITITLDTATFSGWVEAVLTKNERPAKF
jgi:glycosyltransferase involved in cell wall biosynthesis